MANIQNEYCPNYIIHPGEYILELIETLGISQTEFAARINITSKHLSNIINGKAGITTETAQSLKTAYNYDPKYWLSLQTAYDIEIKKREKAAQFEKDELKHKKWLEKFDYNELAKLKYIKEEKKNNIGGMINNLLSFFECSSIESWEAIYGNQSVACRIVGATSKSKFGNIAAWMRNGQISAKKQSETLPKYNKEIFKKNLEKVKDLTVNTASGFEKNMVQLCKEAGVSLIFAREVKGTGLCGAAFWIKNKSVPCIQMSLRFKTNDHFWFTFFHEAGHILNEHKQDILLDKGIFDIDEEIENKANEFASNFLIPSKKYQSIFSQSYISREMIERFAESINIHPGIVVGRLQHDKKISYRYHNGLKQSFAWSDKQ